MIALIDADILRYEIGFAAEVAWDASHPGKDDPVPFEFVASIFEDRLQYILNKTEATDYVLYLTDKTVPTIREQIAKTKPYKTRTSSKPWHFNNLTAYMKGLHPCSVASYIEGDDALAIDHTKEPTGTIVCSRDKDLRQLPGMLFSWDLGNQPAVGPLEIDHLGELQFVKDKNRLTGTGFKFFVAQTLMGDPVDSIPGLINTGATRTFSLLDHAESVEECLEIAQDAYEYVHGHEWQEAFLEQAQLCWLIRRYVDGKPQLWTWGLTK